MPKTPTKLQVNTLTDAMVRGAVLTNASFGAIRARGCGSDGSRTSSPDDT